MGWRARLPMVVELIAGRWIDALAGKRLSRRAVRVGTQFVTGVTTLVFSCAPTDRNAADICGGA